MKKLFACVLAASALSFLTATLSAATQIDLKPVELAVPQGGVSVTAPALYEGLAKTTPPDLSEFASRQPKLRNESLPQDLRERNEPKKEIKKAD